MTPAVASGFKGNTHINSLVVAGGEISLSPPVDGQLAILALIDHDSDTDFITNGLLNSIHPLDFLPTVARIAKVEVGTSSGDASLSARLSQPTNLAMIHHYGYN